MNGYTGSTLGGAGFNGAGLLRGGDSVVWWFDCHGAAHSKTIRREINQFMNDCFLVHESGLASCIRGKLTIFQVFGASRYLSLTAEQLVNIALRTRLKLKMYFDIRVFLKYAQRANSQSLGSDG